jgi:hypothetical protein
MYRCLHAQLAHRHQRGTRPLTDTDANTDTSASTDTNTDTHNHAVTDADRLQTQPAPARHVSPVAPCPQLDPLRPPRAVVLWATDDDVATRELRGLVEAECGVVVVRIVAQGSSDERARPSRREAEGGASFGAFDARGGSQTEEGTLAGEEWRPSGEGGGTETKEAEGLGTDKGGEATRTHERMRPSQTHTQTEAPAIDPTDRAQFGACKEEEKLRLMRAALADMQVYWGYDLGCRVQGLECRVQGVGCGVWGVGLRV